MYYWKKTSKRDWVFQCLQRCCNIQKLFQPFLYKLCYFLDLSIYSWSNFPKSILRYFFILQPSNSAGRIHFPWHENVNIARRFVETELYIVHPVMQGMLYHFVTKWVEQTFISNRMMITYKSAIMEADAIKRPFLKFPIYVLIPDMETFVWSTFLIWEKSCPSQWRILSNMWRHQARKAQKYSKRNGSLNVVIS